MEVQTLNYKTLKKLQRTNDKIVANHSIFDHSPLENKLYKQLKELADEMINSVQYVINHRGVYPNAGWQEEQEFIKIIDAYRVRWNATQRENLITYIQRLRNKLILE